MAFRDQYDLARDPIFVQRVQVGIVKSAIAVQNEGNDTEGHVARASFAYQVLLNPENYARLIAQGVATNDVITEASSDSDIEFTINSMWNAYSNVQ